MVVEVIYPGMSSCDKVFIMKIEVSKFGLILISRPAGREAYLSAKAYLFEKKFEKLEFDFKGVKVLSPSWISEFIENVKKDYPGVKIVFLPSDNPSISYSLEML